MGSVRPELDTLKACSCVPRASASAAINVPDCLSYTTAVGWPGSSTDQSRSAPPS